METELEAKTARELRLSMKTDYEEQRQRFAQLVSKHGFLRRFPTLRRLMLAEGISFSL